VQVQSRHWNPYVLSVPLMTLFLYKTLGGRRQLSLFAIGLNADERAFSWSLRTSPPESEYPLEQLPSV